MTKQYKILFNNKNHGTFQDDGRNHIDQAIEHLLNNGLSHQEIENGSILVRPTNKTGKVTYQPVKEEMTKVQAFINNHYQNDNKSNKL